MIITSTNDIKGYKIIRYLGLINMNVVVGVNFFSDFFASITDVFGGYSTEYQSKLDKIYADAIRALEIKAIALRADAIIGVHFDFDEISGKGKQMFMVTAYGTAVMAEPIKEEIKKVERYEVYERLYNLSIFKDKGVITPEQYDEEKKSILFRFEEAINKELEDIKADNANKEVEIQAQLAYQEKKEKERIELEKEREKRRLEEIARMSEKEKFALLRKEKEEDINKAIDVFTTNAPLLLVKIRELLENNIKDPKEELSKLTKSEIDCANYGDMGLKPTDNTAYCIGLFLVKERYADACKYYIDLVNDDDINEAISYINSVYDILSFKSQSAFVAMAKNLVELKVLGKEEDAICEFANYALCSQEIAKQVIDML